MKILICNDDGVYAPGINALRKELEQVADVTVVAPLEERSTTGHTLTLDHPLRVVEIEKNVYGCSGYPADCALLGLAHIMKNDRPDLVVSGINRGANMGQDVYYSGTVAAAREATFHNIPSIAVSSVVDFQSPKPAVEHFQTAGEFIKEMIKERIHEKLQRNTLLNVNVPNRLAKDLNGVRVTELGFRRYSEEILERRDFRDRRYFWIGGVYSGFDPCESSDCHSTEEGYVSVTPLNLISSESPDYNFWAKQLKPLMEWRG
jgi:5'-nucleotidase